MTTATQQIPSNPALDFAQSILDVTDNGLELIEILRDIAQDTDEVASTNDRIAATNILNDRAFGKSPRQVSPNPGQASKTDDNHVEAIRESTPDKPESPRLVTQIDESLNRSLGPAPSASRHTPQATEPFDPNSVHFIIQQHILAITNNGQMMRDILLEIARACPEPVEGAEDDPETRPEPRRRVTPYHRRRAVVLLLERALGADPNAVLPDCRRKRSPHDGSTDQAESRPKKVPDYRNAKVDPEALAEARAKIQRMKDEGILTPYPKGSRPRITVPEIPEGFDITPYKEEAAKFWADIELTLERQKQWPEIEERRRKKLEQIYPSHSDDKSSEADPPDT